MENGRWVWDDAKKDLRFMKDRSKSYNLRSLDKFKYTRKRKANNKQELFETEDNDRLVTLNDIKQVALGLITEASLKSATQSATRLFDYCYKTEAMENLLWCTLKYYLSILKYRKVSCDEGLDGESEASEKARANLKKSSDSLNQCESDLSAAYILLISGISMECSHHSLQGQLRYSKTLVDRQFFEILYEYLMIVTWITFEYENWEDIHAEIGRAMRTNAFNRDIPITSSSLSTTAQSSRYTSSKTNHDHMSAKIHVNRPELGSLKKLKSPLAQVLYPNLLNSESLGKPIPKLDAADTEDIGIIGTAFLNYVPDTLKLKEEIIMQRREEEWRRQEQQEYSSSSDDELSTTSTSPYDTDPPS